VVATEHAEAARVRHGGNKLWPAPIPNPTENTGYSIPSSRQSAVRSEITDAIVMHLCPKDNIRVRDMIDWWKELSSDNLGQQRGRC
jgi:hypothetical protein